MNIFLDTNILYKDPFWKGNFSKELIEIVKEKEINIYISSIVLKELERNYGKILEDEIQKLKKTNEQINHYEMIASGVEKIDKESSIANLKAFYGKLVDEGVLKLINYKNEILPEVVERAVWRKKPFSEGKTELKDAIIWLSYSEHAEINKLDDCILLTDNVTDFCDPEKTKAGVFEIHPDLIKDSNRFKVYKSTKELIQSEKKQLQFASQRFTAWLSQQTFDSRFLLRLIENNFMSLVERKVEDKFGSLDLYDIFDDDYFLTGYVSPDDVILNTIEEINIDVFNEECLISGELFVDCNIEGYEYNAVRDPGEDRHHYYGNRDVLIRLSFSFNYDKDENPRNFQIDDFEIVAKM